MMIRIPCKCFAERLRDARSASKKTGDEVAHLIGVSRMSISLWENGKNEPSLSKVAALASILGVTADYLLGLSDSDCGAPVSQTGVNNAANVSGDVSQTAGQDCSSCPTVARLQGQVDLLREMLASRG